MIRPLACAIILAACGSVHGDQPDAAAGDSAANADSSLSTDAHAPRCDATKPFAAAVPVANINSPANEQAARLSSDELTIYFASDRGGGAGGFDLYTATRSSRDADFSAPTRIISLASAGTEGSPTPTADGLGLILDRAPMASPTSVTLYMATRTSTSADWSATTAMTSVDGSSDAMSGYLTEGGNVLYFVSTRSGNYDIFVATKQGDGTYGAVSAVVPVDVSNTIDATPVGSQDGTMLYFSSNRSGGDVWLATRSSPGGTFGTPVPATDLESADADYPTWLSDDRCVMYLFRNGTSGLGGFDLWVAKKPL
jgi:hypothetical protein